MTPKVVQTTPIPKVVQPGVIPFRSWRVMHAYHLDCIVDSLRQRLDPSAPSGSEVKQITWDWNAVRHDVERYAYATSLNRLRRF